MTKKPDLSDLLRGNPAAMVSREKIERAQRLVGMVQANGVPVHTYDLRHPFSGAPTPRTAKGIAPKLPSMRRK